MKNYFQTKKKRMQVELNNQNEHETIIKWMISSSSCWKWFFFFLFELKLWNVYGIKWIMANQSVFIQEKYDNWFTKKQETGSKKSAEKTIKIILISMKCTISLTDDFHSNRFFFLLFFSFCLHFWLQHPFCWGSKI